MNRPPYLKDKINDHKTEGEWKVHSGNTVIDYKTQGEWGIQFIMIIDFIYSKDSDEIRTMLTKSINIKIMMGNETDEILEEFFKSLLQKYREGLEEKLRGRGFVFESANLLHYDLHKKV